MPETQDSILLTTKKLMGLLVTDTAFDVDLIVHINSVFFALNQMGLGPQTPYSITNENNVWSEFTTDMLLYSGVKTYIFLKVKLMFDPPTSSFVLDSYNNQIREWEYRLTTQFGLNNPIP